MQPHLGTMYRFAYRLTGQREDAEDLVQDVVVKLYGKLGELEALDRPGAWLNKVLYRQFVDDTRRRARRSLRFEGEFADPEGLQSWLESVPDEQPGPVGRLEQDRLQPLVRELLDTLPADHRTLLLLHDVDHWRLDDLSEVVGLPVGTLKSRLHRIRSALRQKVEDKLEPSGAPQRLLK
ncbi:RNA polymerase sigma factor [Marinobacter lacisalsi]|uniref:RNA polymerase sigma factor n=1 Tax=Marinobacter lacisalsi TaxID=475979 RepID=A0ABV8QKL1_9GAMM